MDRRIISIVLFVIVILATVPLITGLLRKGGHEQDMGIVIQKFTFDDERELRILGREVRPLMRPRFGLYYQTYPPAPASAGGTAADERVSPAASNAEAEPSFFATMPPDQSPPRFVAHESANGEVVGIAAESDPTALLIMHDFITGESWPRRELIETAEDLDVRAQRLLDRLTDAPEARDEWRAVTAEGLRPLERLIVLPAVRNNDQPGPKAR